MTKTKCIPRNATIIGSSLRLRAIIERPRIERWPVDITWDQAMRMFDAQRKQYMRAYYSVADRLRDKNPEPFRMD
jgi:hypothetical protein